MAVEVTQMPALKRAVRPHVDLSGEWPGNTPQGLMRDVHKALRGHPGMVIYSYVHSGDPKNDFNPFYVVSRDTMRQLLAAAGLAPSDIPNHLGDL